MAIRIMEDGHIIYRPYGVIAKEDRERADRLDDVLKTEMPKIAKETMKKAESENTLAKWYFFGCEIAKIVDDTDLVLRSDIESGDVWLAMRQNLPKKFPLKWAGEENPPLSLQRRDRDHFMLCYALSQFDWDKINWIKNWHHWRSIYIRESFLNERIFKALADAIKKLKEYPSTLFFDAIMRALVKRFPQGTDVSLLKMSEIRKSVGEAIKEARKMSKGQSVG